MPDRGSRQPCTSGAPLDRAGCRGSTGAVDRGVHLARSRPAGRSSSSGRSASGVVDAQEARARRGPAEDAPGLVVDARCARRAGRARRAHCSAVRERVAAPSAGTAGRAAGTRAPSDASTPCRYVRRYASYAEQQRRVVVQPVGPQRLAVAGREQAGRHVDALEVAAEHEERQPSSRLIVESASRRASRRGPCTQRKKSCGRPAGAEPRPARQRVVRRVERLPHLRRDRLARAARVLPGRGRASDVIDAGFVVSKARSSVTPSASRRGRSGRRRRRPSRRAGRRTRPPRRPTGPRAGGGSGRRGGARCPRPARCSGRSSTATRRCGSARARLSSAAAVVAAGCPLAWTRAAVAVPAAARPAPAARPARRVRRPARGPSRRGGEHPRVLRPAALARVHDQAALRQRDPGQPAGHDPDPLAVVDRERPQVEVARAHRVVDVGRRGRQRDRLLRDPAARVRRAPAPRSAASVSSSACGPITSP